MPLPIFQVDAFASAPFAGNPAAVCLLRDTKEPGWMQQVASEMNVSETAFLSPREDGFGLRWFTPKVEVDLCGHATLASAHVLWEIGELETDAPARFFTRSGLLTAVRDGDWIEMDFPATPADGVDPPSDLIDALGVTPEYVGKNQFDYLVELATEEDVQNLRPDLGRLAALGSRGVIVTSRSRRRGTDFVSRFFAPSAGIDEDPVTGSAHCCLAPYWHRQLHQDAFVAEQLSPRGGLVRVRLHDDRVRLSGQAVTVIRGELIP